MIEQTNPDTDSEWRRFIRRHATIFAVFIAAAVLAAAGAVYVFVWFTGNAQSTGLVPSSLSLWSMNSVLTFILHGIFWELFLIGIPVAIAAVVGWQWWKRLPEVEKHHHSGKGSKSSRAGGAISPLLLIAFAIKVYIDGNWNQAIASWNLDYVIGSMITILIWTVAIFAIPAVIGIVWWIRHEAKKP
jgi:hypothetical protein